ncbi:MAG: sedoheptulose 7-phosphate cyclase [Candidatus Scalindua sp.]
MLLKKPNLLHIKQKLDIDYSVFFLDGIFNYTIKGNPLSKLCDGRRIMVVLDDDVYKIYGKEIEGFFNKKNNIYYLHRLDASESIKNIFTVINLCEAANKFRMHRDSLFIGIGGGITMDIVGFAAFIYRRGTSYIKIPTTLVGFIDAGVGIKVGVNFKESKNLLGGYHAPIAVFNDQSLLKQLKTSDIRCGLYEIIKISIIKDLMLFKLIEKHYTDYFQGKLSLQTSKINYSAAYLMMQELENNLLESNRQRIVDFGHTFSPIIEISSKYAVPHGEAVGIDILISCFLALKRGILIKKDYDRIFSLIKLIGFTNTHNLPPSKEIHSSLEEIRNHRGGNLNLVLPSRIGSSIFSNECSIEELEESIGFFLSTELFS